MSIMWLCPVGKINFTAMKAGEIFCKSLFVDLLSTMEKLHIWVVF